MGVGAFPETHPLSLKWLGIRGSVTANNAANDSGSAPGLRRV